MAPITRGNSLYTIVDGPTWTQAEANAVKLGGHLATVNDSSENEFLSTIVRSEIIRKYNLRYGYGDLSDAALEWRYNPLIGFSDSAQEGRWKWANEESPTYTNWFPGEPNATGSDSDYAVMYFYGWRRNSEPLIGTWDDTSGGTIGIAEIPFIQRGDSAYVIVEGPTWAEAQANAVKLGGNLVTINDAAENEWLINAYRDKLAVQDRIWGGLRSGAYIGLTDSKQDGRPNWINNENSPYRNYGLVHQDTGTPGLVDGWLLLMLDPSGEAQRRGGLGTWWAEPADSIRSNWLYNYGIAEIKLFSTPTYTLSTSASSINEGSTLTTTVSTTNVTAGTTLYYALSGT
ncbi:MAG: hypothetical protein FJ076_09125, partial [Cyanobacteria bacterium K_DeepCast_35m_m1_288]|nr:hypothetical protein [Cyanobacteria bacterium K_DeepCast_35m_m1_288]